ncbi:MAG: bifunctional DNA-formamidopyrimidine glycosylase/DNA-(apurinic or apyrimidinic site) lyase [Nonomuraea sp.]|nr:bifunctional DNA-formamidopyrimidine glycosylase/DNA-(apurinic or apyrimidinic site) lyase [Nonomuraea sp.]NUP65825.1 bifunctional DNA-formamidopyrimidine glycosylase/DNA-(apurinic or apyrimidinic site) lyase [Nonomuraea sp.]NUP83815.1 bifunctional DNA-formamidopyrimidine glycosylase/DNA-(apurinic or apyrimidinic site) lyase [Nonomuraea sp.]NUT44014.1 bifunctional DNA-formamidopyrimidine glycosylase/DNA-(apurinic or apyrimidinic site) lyase [Thermoactinospora sp.]
MPELPEVEVVRRGLAQWVVGREIADAEVLHPRAIRRHAPGADEFTARLKGRAVKSAERRGKYLWLPLSGADEALMAHLGMSGQLLVVDPDAPPEKHLRVRLRFEDGGPDLRFVDQRTFGHVMLSDLAGGVPEPIAHIAPDPFEAAFDEGEFTRRLRAKRTEVKRALLDQSLISGVGNIYADEALWIAKLHWARPTETLTRPKIAELLAGVRTVMGAALQQGGTSFDSLYVNVNGESGYFDRSLEVYGRRDLPCSRCGTGIRREAFMNRSSYSCPTCQRKPR